MRNNFTPGPWFVSTNYSADVIAENGVRVALSTAWDYHPEGHANARLIAAAPNMFAALLRVRGHICACGDEQALEQLDAALAKATEAL